MAIWLVRTVLGISIQNLTVGLHTPNTAKESETNKVNVIHFRA